MEEISLRQFCEDVEARIDPDQEEKLEQEWKSFCALRCKTPFFSPCRTPKASRLEWPQIPVNHAMQDETLMIYTQLKSISDLLAKGSGLLLSVRANYGTGIIPSMFGAEMFYLPDEADTLPCTRPLAGGAEALKEILDTSPDFSRGLAPKVFSFAYRWKELVREYPKIQRYVSLYNPDLQGPFPLADMLAGNDIYYALYEEPEFVLDALSYMTDLYLSFTKKWQNLCPSFDDGHSVEWGLLHRGKTILRNDALVNLSNEMYRSFVMPYDAKIFEVLGGGMHFCGRGDHYIASACELKGLSCINLSQPELNDMEKIYASSVDHEILIIGMAESEVLRAAKTGRNLYGRVQSGAALSAYRD